MRIRHWGPCRANPLGGATSYRANLNMLHWLVFGSGPSGPLGGSIALPAEFVLLRVLILGKRCMWGLGRTDPHRGNIALAGEFVFFACPKSGEIAGMWGSGRTGPKGGNNALTGEFVLLRNRKCAIAGFCPKGPPGGTLCPLCGFYRSYMPK